MTNPDNTVRVRARKNGRASVYEANAWAQPYSTGALTGTAVTATSPATLGVTINGDANAPAIVIAKNPSGYKIALDLTAEVSLPLTAPASTSQIVAIVAYTDDLSVIGTDSEETGSPSSCGLLAVYGTASSSPVAPSDAAIRTAITADGANGAEASYAILATISLTSTTTAVSANNITTNISSIEPVNLAGAIIEVTTTDPGEGVDLPANHFIAVVKAE